MSIYNREQQYINILSTGEYTVKELANKLFVSEPTVRRDVLTLVQKGLISRKKGRISLEITSADMRIPLFIREIEMQKEKQEIALKAISHIKNGNVIMLDASTTAYCLAPHLINFEKIIVITNGAKLAIELVAMGIKTICTGGELTHDSFSYIGTDAEDILRRYNADVAFFSCRGISEDGLATDNSILENSMRRIMIQNSKKSYLLCDSSKFGKKYLYTLCNTRQIDEIITNS